MSYSRISVEKAGPFIGAEVSGVRLNDELDDQTIAEIRSALNENGVIWFRRQELSPAGQVAFASRIGEVYIHPTAQQTATALAGEIPLVPGVYPLKADENTTSAYGEVWHSDASCDANPPMGTILQLLELPKLGGDTMFSSMVAAYKSLSEPMRSYLDGLTATHDSTPIFTKRNFTAARQLSEHPVVCTHESGQKVLFVNSMYTTRINEVPPDESDAVLRFLYHHVDNPVYHYRFHWEPGSVLFWDNRLVQHRAVFDYAPQRRVGTRVTIMGKPPVR